ncbi:MAG: helix-turn-helix domain-containing protein [Clostridiales bacterium]|nr:helix-turn-helix domain-containing protein [Clostridiales bacterium]
MDQKKTGQFLKMLRNEKKLTQEQLAKHFNVSNRSVSRWETGTNLPDISLLVEIADFYDVDVREIIDGERKSEMMDTELREVADKMATYATGEKSRLLKFVQVVSIIGVVVTIIALVLQTISYEPDTRRAGAVLATFIGFVIMCVITLYVTGILQKIGRHRTVVKAIKIATIVVMALVTQYVLSIFILFGLFYWSIASEKIEVNTDINEYNEYIHGGSKSNHQIGNYEVFDVFPETIPSGASAVEYRLAYYNPWDPQMVVYMTLDLGDGYDEEIERLEQIGIMDYTDYYSVTDEPEGYDLVAMHSDSYYGFVYAMVPENSDGNTKITYVAIVFCNYALDLDVHDYMKDEYLLPGFDATDDNPYRKEMMGK